MKNYLIIVVLMLSAITLTVGCSRIQEPWVQSEKRLVEERTRTPDQIRKLQDRFLQVQTDR